MAVLGFCSSCLRSFACGTLCSGQASKSRVKCGSSWRVHCRRCGAILSCCKARPCSSWLATAAVLCMCTCRCDWLQLRKPATHVCVAAPVCSCANYIPSLCQFCQSSILLQALPCRHKPCACSRDAGASSSCEAAAAGSTRWPAGQLVQPAGVI
jgi:hypothetical protein